MPLLQGCRRNQEDKKSRPLPFPGHRAGAISLLEEGPGVHPPRKVCKFERQGLSPRPPCWPQAAATASTPDGQWGPSWAPAREQGGCWESAGRHVAGQSLQRPAACVVLDHHRAWREGAHSQPGHLSSPGCGSCCSPIAAPGSLFSRGVGIYFLGGTGWKLGKWAQQRVGI